MPAPVSGDGLFLYLSPALLIHIRGMYFLKSPAHPGGALFFQVDFQAIVFFLKKRLAKVLRNRMRLLIFVLLNNKGDNATLKI